ncbi:type II toxin-antitoxin system YafQ family toxin [Candidatus Peregrinibacteria bacterium]|nr:type II toxin-antitoxin system YafQ family toxin [Candidatus Peregrinibacteria bacterium]
MYRVKESKSFRRDVKRLEKSKRYDPRKLLEAMTILASGERLPEHYRDHALKGDVDGSRECHIESDWLLVYRYQKGALILQLIRTGTHSQLFHE